MLLAQSPELLLDGFEVHLFAFSECALGCAVLGSAALSRGKRWVGQFRVSQKETT